MRFTRGDLVVCGLLALGLDSAIPLPFPLPALLGAVIAILSTIAFRTELGPAKRRARPVQVDQETDAFLRHWEITSQTVDSDGTIHTTWRRRYRAGGPI